MAVDHEWLEATHCFYFNPKEHTSASSPMWFFAAPGAGISINVGRTLTLQASLHGPALVAAVHHALRGGGKASRPVRRALQGQAVNAPQGKRAVQQILGPLLRPSTGKRFFSPPYDSVQFEHAHSPQRWGGERFVQVVVLGWGAEMSFLASHINETARLQCGRQPNLRPCVLGDAALRVHGPSCARPVPSMFRSEIECPYSTKAGGVVQSYWNPRLKANVAELEAKRLSNQLGS